MERKLWEQLSLQINVRREHLIPYDLELQYAAKRWSVPAGIGQERSKADRGRGKTGVGAIQSILDGRQLGYALRRGCATFKKTRAAARQPRRIRPYRCCRLNNTAFFGGSRGIYALRLLTKS